MPLPRNVRAVGHQFRAVVSIDGIRKVGPRRDSPALAAQDVARIRAEHRRAEGSLELQQAHALLMQELEAGGAAPATLRYYRTHFTPLTGPMGWDTETDVGTITPAECERYAQRRVDAGVSEATAWGKELQVLDRIFAILVRDGVVLASPVKRARKPKRIQRGRFAVLTAARIAECCAEIRASAMRNPERAAAIVELLFATGLRRAELARARVGDVEFAARRIWVRGKVRDEFVPLGPLAEAAARTLIAGRTAAEDPLVPTVRALERMFARLQAITGEGLLTPHVLRHSTATHLLESGMSAFDVAAFMRHTSPRMTWRYHHVSGATQRAAADRLVLHGRRPSPGRG